jgi:hypothetical protein
MIPARKSLVISVDETGQKLDFSYREAQRPQRAGNDLSNFFTLDLYTDSAKTWNPGNAALVGQVVLNALRVVPRRSAETKREDRDRARRIIAEFEDKDRRGLSDVRELRIRAELEFVEYSETGIIQHFLNGEALYRRLAAAGSQEHIEIMKTWNSENEKRARRPNQGE